ncbi:MAG: hypothetical protein GX117_13730 [Candidatus Hydrogenedentes bacterium]|jgi:hypothetical protein|nr:hypothetical protein [Candidatus Hydrogenedentota bacterium]
MKLKLFVPILAVVFVIVPLQHTFAYDPVPGPNYAGCLDRPMPFSKLPVIDLATGKENTPVKKWPVPGEYDFCAYMDTAYCSMEAITSLQPSLLEFVGLLQCLDGDMNGPVNLAEEIPMTPNGIPDGTAELAIVAAILNDPGHALYQETLEKFQHNVNEAKFILIQAYMHMPPLGSFPGGDMRATIRLLVPYLSGSLLSLMGAYGVLGDDDSLNMLDALLETLQSFLANLPLPEGGVRAILQSVPALNHEGDANNDGFTNRQAYEYFVEHLGYSEYEYSLFAVSPDYPIDLMQVDGGGVFVFGSTMELTAVIDGLVAEALDPYQYTWYKDGLPIPEATENMLILDNGSEADSGLYEVRVPVRWLLGDAPGDPLIVSASVYVQFVAPVPLIPGVACLFFVAIFITCVFCFSFYRQITIRT